MLPQETNGPLSAPGAPSSSSSREAAAFRAVLGPNRGRDNDLTAAQPSPGAVQYQQDLIHAMRTLARRRNKLKACGASSVVLNLLNEESEHLDAPLLNELLDEYIDTVVPLSSRTLLKAAMQLLTDYKVIAGPDAFTDTDLQQWKRDRQPGLKTWLIGALKHRPGPEFLAHMDESARIGIMSPASIHRSRTAVPSFMGILKTGPGWATATALVRLTAGRERAWLAQFMDCDEKDVTPAQLAAARDPEFWAERIRLADTEKPDYYAPQRKRIQEALAELN